MSSPHSVRHHSQAWPAMSWQPWGERPRGKSPTAQVSFSPVVSPFARSSSQARPQGCTTPDAGTGWSPRAARSHSRSVGRRTTSPGRMRPSRRQASPSQSQKARASCQVRSTAGMFARSGRRPSVEAHGLAVAATKAA